MENEGNYGLFKKRAEIALKLAEVKQAIEVYKENALVERIANRVTDRVVELLKEKGVL